MESETKVHTFRIRMLCDEENCDGEMFYTGRALMSEPPQYTHQCIKCKKEKIYYETFPTIRYRELL